MQSFRMIGLLGMLAGLLAPNAGAQSKAPAAKAPAAPKPAKASEAPGTPHADFDATTKDVGTVAKGDKIDVVFKIKNGGSQDLQIFDARPSCGCTVASFDKLIKPGTEGKIEATVDTKDVKGPATKSIVVTTNDPEKPQINLFIKADVKPFVDVDPAESVRFSVVRGDSQDQEVTLISEGAGFEPKATAPTQPYVKVSIRAAEEKEKVAGRAGKQFKLRVSVTPEAPEGLLNVPLSIDTGVEKQKKVEVRVSGIVRPRLSVVPLAITFGNFQPGPDPITRNVTVVNNKPAVPVKVTKAEVNVPGIVVDIVPIQEGASYTIVLKVTDKIKKGNFDGTLKIYTTDKEKATIDIPVHGEVV